MVKISDYSDLVNRLKISFFENSNVVDLINSDSPQYNELEDVFFSLTEDRWLDTAQGKQLDILGEILDLERYGRDDESYRTLLNLKVEINTSSGTPEIVIKTVKLLYGATEISYIPAYPAGFEIQHNGASALFFLNNLITTTGDNIVLLSGDNLTTREPDSIADSLLTSVIPSGVKITITGV
jgi:hypothetical protein